MVASNHSGAGTQSDGYNHAYQRIFVRNGSSVTYCLYGLGWECRMEFQETCAGGACNGYQENQRWIYFSGRKMFSKTGSALKAVTPHPLASEPKHFPYGETDGTPPADTKDYFATYRRDGTGLDYAWNRYYSPAMGRFTTADPYGGNENTANPGSWNRYSYTENNPANWIDPDGLNLQHLVPFAFGGGWDWWRTHLYRRHGIPGAHGGQRYRAQVSFGFLNRGSRSSRSNPQCPQARRGPEVGRAEGGYFKM